MPQIKPQYIVQKLDGKRKRTVASPAKKGGFDYKDVEEPAGYMVFFPSGSSIRIRTDDELKRLGFDSPANLVDMESGEVVGSMKDMSFHTMTNFLPDAEQDTSIIDNATE
jgi:hypothetical protein|tara:strand:+ start:191 stop:520 length:330 start_codon:yes stop_codon:yes gene_type:complete